MLVCKTVGRGVARVKQGSRDSASPGIPGFPEGSAHSAPGTGHPGGGSTRNSPGFTRNHTGITGISCSKLPMSRLFCSCSSMVLIIVFVDSHVFRDGVFRVVVIEGRSLPRKSEKNSVVNFYHQTNYRSNKNRDICRKFSVRLFTRSFVGPIEKIGLLKAAAVDSLRALAGPLFPHWQRYGRRALWQVLLSSPLTWLLRHSAPP